ARALALLPLLVAGRVRLRDRARHVPRQHGVPFDAQPPFHHEVAERLDRRRHPQAGPRLLLALPVDAADAAAEALAVAHHADALAARRLLGVPDPALEAHAVHRLPEVVDLVLVERKRRDVA